MCVCVLCERKKERVWEKEKEIKSEGECRKIEITFLPSRYDICIEKMKDENKVFSLEINFVKNFLFAFFRPLEYNKT